MTRTILVLALLAFEVAAQETTEAVSAQAPGAEIAAQDTAEAETEYFDVWEYRVGGNTVLENRDIERAVY
ncbi:MAG: ShlB/FhaC/HecB family hemolysin secretion/activation protein, partial [Pseudomonadota bacterium]